MGETRRLEGLGQLGFAFPMTKSSGVPARSPGDEAVVFLDADPCELFVGAQRLDAYLREVGLGWVLRLAGLLRELDLSALIGAISRPDARPFIRARCWGLSSMGLSTGSGHCGNWKDWRGATLARGGCVAVISPITAPSASLLCCTAKS